MSKKNSREEKAKRRAERAASAAAATALLSAPAKPHSHNHDEVCPKCGKTGDWESVIIHFPEAVFEFPHDFEKRYEVIYERKIFKHTHRWALLRSASDAEKEELRGKLTEKYRRKPRKRVAEEPPTDHCLQRPNGHADVGGEP